MSKGKHKKSREIHFKNTEEFFFRERYKAIKLIKQVFARKNASLEWKRIEMRKGRSSRKKNFVFVRFFWRKNCEGEYFNTRIFFTTFGKKWRIEICFVFEKSTKMRIQRREVSTIEFFFTTKRRCCFPIFQRSFLHCEK